jgi:hypothetical protein
MAREADPWPLLLHVICSRRVRAEVGFHVDQLVMALVLHAMLALPDERPISLECAHRSFMGQALLGIRTRTLGSSSCTDETDWALVLCRRVAGVERASTRLHLPIPLRLYAAPTLSSSSHVADPVLTLR